MSDTNIKGALYTCIVLVGIFSYFWGKRDGRRAERNVIRFNRPGTYFIRNNQPLTLSQRRWWNN